MDYLQKAKTLMEDYSVSEGDVAWMRQDAAIYAAIAQAEQLKRIGDLLERYIGPATPVDPELEDYRRNCIPGESIEEYKHRVREGELNESLEEYKWFKKNNGLL